MSKDISKIVQGWDYVPGEVLARSVRGDDGRELIQLRIELGILQMERDGRPDGDCPEDFPSWLDCYEQKQAAFDEEHQGMKGYQLDEEACERLWHEGIQYYHRYVAFWNLRMYDLCARDTQRNLRLFAFVCAHVADVRHQLQFDQWRPYVIMMNTRAVATPWMVEEQFGKAAQIIDAGIDAIRDFLEEYEQMDRGDDCTELASLERWREEVLGMETREAASRPKSAATELREKLNAAVAAEQFEEAARLRDELRGIEREGDRIEDD